MREREVSVSSVALPRRMTANQKGRLLSSRPGIANPACARDVAAVLLDYLETRLGVCSLAFTQEPVAFTQGWETYCYHFQLQSPDPLAPVFAQPLTVRIYSGPLGLPRARREILAQRYLHQLNYPVAEPLFLEESCAYLGGPFLVVAQVCGPTLLQALLRQPWRLFQVPVQMAELHVRLHRLPTNGFPAPPDCLLARRLDEMASAICAYALRGLRPGLDWLCVNRPGPAKNPRILHLDFHPLNLIVAKDRSLVVLDWNEADLGDPHADIGTTVMLMDCLPPIEVTRLERLSILTGRPWFLSGYLRAYRRHLPLEKNTLSYYRALAAFHRLCNCGRWLQDGPEISGNKPSLLQCITDSHRQTLERYFRKWTGVGVRL